MGPTFRLAPAPPARPDGCPPTIGVPYWGADPTGTPAAALATPHQAEPGVRRPNPRPVRPIAGRRLALSPAESGTCCVGELKRSRNPAANRLASGPSHARGAWAGPERRGSCLCCSSMAQQPGGTTNRPCSAPRCVSGAGRMGRAAHDPWPTPAPMTAARRQRRRGRLTHPPVPAGRAGPKHQPPRPPLRAARFTGLGRAIASPGAGPAARTRPLWCC